MNYEDSIKYIDERDKRIEKVTELLQQPLLELKERLLFTGWLENKYKAFYNIGERISEDGNTSIGLARIIINMEYNSQTFVVFRNYNGLEFSCRAARMVRDIDEARTMVKYFERAEAELRKEFAETIEPMIPESIWEICA